MEEARNFYVRNKPRVVLSKTEFPVIQGFSIGDTGQILVSVTKKGEFLRSEEDGTERIGHRLKIIKVEVIKSSDIRI